MSWLWARMGGPKVTDTWKTFITINCFVSKFFFLFYYFYYYPSDINIRKYSSQGSKFSLDNGTLSYMGQIQILQHGVLTVIVDISIPEMSFKSKKFCNFYRGDILSTYFSYKSLITRESMQFSALRQRLLNIDVGLYEFACIQRHASETRSLLMLMSEGWLLTSSKCSEKNKWPNFRNEWVMNFYQLLVTSEQSCISSL